MRLFFGIPTSGILLSLGPMITRVPGCLAAPVVTAFSAFPVTIIDGRLYGRYHRGQCKTPATEF